MDHEPLGRPLPLGRHEQGRARQLGAQMLAHRPAHHLARRQVEHRGQVEPALVRRNVADIAQPDPVGTRRLEVLPEQVGGDRQAVAAVGGDGAEASRGDAADAMPAHQALDPAAAGWLRERLRHRKDG